MILRGHDILRTKMTFFLKKSMGLLKNIFYVIIKNEE